jgi:hypothetical protein
MPCFDLIEFQPDLLAKGPDDQSDNQEVDDQQQGLFDAPRHAITSNRGSNFDVDVPCRPQDAPKACSLVDEELVQSGRKVFWHVNPAAEQGDHARTAGA